MRACAIAAPEVNNSYTYGSPHLVKAAKHIHHRPVQYLNPWVQFKASTRSVSPPAPLLDIRDIRKCAVWFTSARLEAAQRHGPKFRSPATAADKGVPNRTEAVSDLKQIQHSKLLTVQLQLQLSSLDACQQQQQASSNKRAAASLGAEYEAIHAGGVVQGSQVPLRS